MTDIYWPPSLPQVPLISGYKHGTANNVMHFKMEYGPEKTRRRTTSGVSSRTWRFSLNRKHKDKSTGEVIDQLAVLLNFMKKTEGLSIWFPDPENNRQYIRVKIVSESEDTGVEIVPESSRFWDVTLQVKVFPHAVRTRS